MTEIHSLLTGALACVVCAFVGCARPQVDRERLKEELKQEILKELAAEKDGEAPTARATEDIAAHPQAAQLVALPTGNVRGRVLLGDKGLPGCSVRLIRLEGGGVGGLFSIYRETQAYEAKTDEKGNYRFEAVPVGAYALRWLPKGETGWIRRLSEKPDDVVEPGLTSDAGVFRAGRSLLNG